MVCDHCGRSEATVHVLGIGPLPDQPCHLCEPCARRRTVYGCDLLSSDAELAALGWFCTSGRVVAIDRDTVTILVESGSKVQKGQRLIVRASFVPESQRKVDAEFGFCCPADAVQFVVVEPPEGKPLN